MTLKAELDSLARRLAPHGSASRTVMISALSAGAGASTITSGLALCAAEQGVSPIWVFDLDFQSNAQANRTRLNGQVFNASVEGRTFWRCVPEKAGRLAMRRMEGAPIFISRFERPPGSVRSLTFHKSPEYWSAIKRRAGLVLVDAPFESAGLPTIASDLDGVIIVVNAKTDTRAMAQAHAARLENSGAKVLGLVVNRSAGEST